MLIQVFSQTSNLVVIERRELGADILKFFSREAQNDGRSGIKLRETELFEAINYGCIVAPDLNPPVEVGISRAKDRCSPNRSQQPGRRTEGVHLVFRTAGAIGLFYLE